MLTKIKKFLSDFWKESEENYYMVWAKISLNKFLELNPISKEYEGDFRKFAKYLENMSYYNWLVVKGMFFDKELEVMAAEIRERRKMVNFYENTPKPEAQPIKYFRDLTNQVNSAENLGESPVFQTENPEK